VAGVDGLTGPGLRGPQAAAGVDGLTGPGLRGLQAAAGVDGLTGLTVFIPAFNEAGLMRANLARLTGFLEGLGRPFQIVVGSNGSFDPTPRLGAELAAADPRIVFFHLPRKGPGAAFREGLGRAAFEKIISLDMDLSTDLAFIPRALNLLDDHDLVIGSKRLGDQRRSWIRITSSGLFILAARLLLGLDYRDYSLGAKGYRRSLVRELKGWVGPDTSYVLNLIFWAHRLDRRVIEIPVFCHDDRRSRFNLAREGVSRLSRLLQLWYRARRGLAGPWEGDL